MEARIEGNDEVGYFIVIKTDELTETTEYEIISKVTEGLEDGTYIWNYDANSWDTKGIWLQIPENIVLGSN